ncbi:MAG: dehydratase [Actinomycetota bacterium]|nr:dehydratase [Actinomycetota bacterium]
MTTLAESEADQSTPTWAVGDRLPPLEIGRITRTDLALFAGGSGDHNPIHLDLDVARAAGLEDVFAQGMLSMAYLGRLLTDHVVQSRLRSLSTRFVATTPVGAEPTCHAEVVAIDGDVVTLSLEVVLGDGTVSLAGQATVSVEGTA